MIDLTKPVSTVLGPVTVTDHALTRYRERHIEDTGAKPSRCNNSRMLDRLVCLLGNAVEGHRRNGNWQILRHIKPARYLISGRWVMVISEKSEVLTVYVKRSLRDITKLYDLTGAYPALR